VTHGTRGSFSCSHGPSERTPPSALDGSLARERRAQRFRCRLHGPGMAQGVDGGRIADQPAVLQCELAEALPDLIAFAGRAFGWANLDSAS